ncbi:hypothetical protein HDU93_005972, partial [Gonapodya sp. JEL0774]
WPRASVEKISEAFTHTTSDDTLVVVGSAVTSAGDRAVWTDFVLGGSTTASYDTFLSVQLAASRQLLRSVYSSAALLPPESWCPIDWDMWDLEPLISKSRNIVARNDAFVLSETERAAVLSMFQISTKWIVSLKAAIGRIVQANDFAGEKSYWSLCSSLVGRLSTLLDSLSYSNFIRGMIRQHAGVLTALLLEDPVVVGELVALMSNILADENLVDPFSQDVCVQTVCLDGLGILGAR